ncbi:hypothetical protein SVIOM74S_07897 [Streptomyces violarus]
MGVPSLTDPWATRRNTISSVDTVGDSSAPRTQSNRSTLAKSANRGTTTSISSSAVRTTSRVVPMAAAASFSRASRCRAQYCSVLSMAARAVPRRSPEGSRTGHISVTQACSRFRAGAPV